MSLAPIAASASCISAAVASGGIGTRSSSPIGPVSSPSSIFMMAAAVSASPAMIGRWIGAAPRQRGSRLGCRLRQPCEGTARIAGGSSKP